MIQPLSPQQLPMRQVPSSEKDVAEIRVGQGQGGARRADLIDRMVKGRADRVVRARTREILSALPEGTLRALARDGLTIEVTGAELPKGQKGPVRMGAYFPASKTISVGRGALLSERGRHILLHEVTHAIDYMRSKGGQAESHGNERLAEAYGDFRARAAVQDALRVEAMLQKKNIPLDGHRSVHNDGWGERGLRIQRHADFDRVTFDEQPHWMRGKVAAMAAGGAMAAAASALAIPVLGTVGVVVGAVSALALGVNALFRSLPNADQRQVQATSGPAATVRQDGPVTTVDLPHEATFAPTNWSTYAWRSGKIQEYWAEGVSRFLEGPLNRQALQKADPQVVAEVRRFLAEEGRRP